MRTTNEMRDAAVGDLVAFQLPVGGLVLPAIVIGTVVELWETAEDDLEGVDHVFWADVRIDDGEVLPVPASGMVVIDVEALYRARHTS
ncbi:hypothetical protein ACIBG8_54605 [Nonomuraea sp. NPDC050556]|uniref:hypothetical protein n=1 Tax=Nonomuraea sp. NPDC050556 TaxID=3364369 RepID=UPI00379FB784